MCGIHLRISSQECAVLSKDAKDYLARRGPDSQTCHSLLVTTASQSWHVSIAASVLSLRGDAVQVQPVIDEATGSVFTWNGEAWYVDGTTVLSNDTMLLATRLFRAIKDSEAVDSAIADVLAAVQGPYAFVLLDSRHQKIYFGRDPLGRRSLLSIDDHANGTRLTVCSVDSMSNEATKEVDVETLHVVDLCRSEIKVEPVSRRITMPLINSALPSNETDMGDLPIPETIGSLISELTQAIKPRVEAVPTYNVAGDRTDPSRVAILFSGGLDCTLLARLVHDVLPKDQPVDLLNVGFENPRVISAREAKDTSSTVTDAYELCPDRITGRSSFAELGRVCPGRMWRFVAVDVPYHEFQKHRSTIIRLMYPHNTEMDLSISAALYFAARGQGKSLESGSMISAQEYTTTARVLLSGLGADELFGGYARHAAAFSRGSYSSLIDELELDFVRIGQRNLGRDDRVVSHWAREMRYPFLDENFVKLALGLPAWEKCGFRPGRKVPKHFETTIAANHMHDLHPEKLLLRCAAWQLGMTGAAAEKKRAIQFGARTAKMHAGKTKGTDSIAVDVRG